MSNGNEYQDTPEEDQEELDENDYKTQRDAILFAIEVSPSMLEASQPAGDSKKQSNDSPVEAALKSAYRVMQQRLISNPKDLMGVLFFGTEKSKFQTDSTTRPYPHCYLFIDLDIPSASDVKALKYLSEDGDDSEQILKPSAEPVMMSNVLFCANQIFTTRAANFGSRRLFIITDNDNPHTTDKQLRSAAAVRAKDLYDLGVVIELFPVSKAKSGTQSFDTGKFYDDIVYRDPAHEAEFGVDRIKTSQAVDGLSLLDSLVANIASREVMKRALFSGLPFEIAPDLRVTVKGYNIIHPQKAPGTRHIWLEGEKPQIAQGATLKYSEEESARSIEKGELLKAYKFGGEFVHFSPEEQKEIRNFGPPVLRIIGFKPRSALPAWASVKKSTFIYPSETEYTGSTRVFTALWMKLQEKQKMAVAWLIARSNSAPLLVAILPSQAPAGRGAPPPATTLAAQAQNKLLAEKKAGGDKGGVGSQSSTPYLPAGLWLYPLPFADDLRPGTEPPETIPQASQDLKDKMRFIVQQLQLPDAIYKPAKFPNPALQWHYRILQALALDEEVPDKPKDATVPRYKAINKNAGGYIHDWIQQLTIDEKLTNVPAGAKRGAREDGKATKKPRVRKEEEDTGGMKIDETALKQTIRTGSISKSTVVELRQLLTKLNLDTKGRKGELVARLEEWAES